MIKTISEVDPTGALLNAMTDQYRQYLHHRPDSMKCIVNKLTNSSDNGGASMLQELADAMDTQIDSDKEGEDDEMAFKAATAWEPDPIIDTEIVRRNEKRLNDVVSTLVGVYGSKDMFIEEYRKTLGEKLLSKTDYDCDHEIQTLELLKLRFDETALHNCEVMLKDMGDSKRINSTLVNNEGTSAAVERRSRRGEQLDQANLSATIISELFWPELPDTDIKLPPEIRQRLDVYADRYHQHKAPRKLVWRTGLGSVELAVTVGRTTRSFTVNPTYAMILYMFQALSRWTPDDLARELGLTPQVLRAKALFWVNNGVLVEARGRRGDMFYQRAEALDDRAGTAAPADLGLEDEGPSCMTPAPVQGHEELKAFETYIVDFLANGCNPGGCTLEQIHKHLRMFCIRPKYDKLQDQLAAYLATMMERNKVVHQGGLYKIKAGRST
ncbi:unnamed protein product [Ostreobium quekettii]|uniref:Anaphase-promoting complex subunit 2 n=1 Tax=Ostreobium quekettii TaxID=121088 RepID=A0A8S1ILX5_9CHLO|nr:unnamed protein product [Ostreobium quekettii]